MTSAKWKSRFCAPAKVIITGEHSVAHGKRAVAMAISLKCHATFYSAEPLSLNETVGYCKMQFDSHFSETLVFVNDEILKMKQFYGNQTEDFGPPTDEQIQALSKFVSKVTDRKMLLLAGQCFIHIILSVLSKAGDDAFTQFANLNWVLEVKSEVPLGAGLGSSAAVNTVLSACVLDVFGSLQTSGKSLNLTQSDLAMIEKLALAAEHFVHGRPSGVDTSASCHGNAIVFENFAHQDVIKMPYFEVLIVDTKQERNTKALVDKVRHLKETNIAKFEQILTDIDECSRKIEAVLRHMGSNDELAANDFERLKVLMKQNQDLLRDWGVSTDKLESVVNTAVYSHNCAAKLTGAGGGGCAIVFLNPNSEDAILSRQSLIEDLNLLDVEIMHVQISKSGIARKF